jgi:hypothetical protein
MTFSDTQQNVSDVSSRQVFSMRQLKCESVVVFTDRAEVKRLLHTKLKKGENEIVIGDISESIDQDSVRVEGIGHAMVLDVICEEKRIELELKVESNSQLEINDLETKLEESSLKISRIEKQASILSDFAGTIARPDRTSGSNSTLEQIGSAESVQNFMSFVDVYSQNMETLHAEKHAVKKEIAKLQEKVKVLRENSVNTGTHNNYREAM